MAQAQYYLSKEQQESGNTHDTDTAALAVSERAPEATALLEFTDDLLDEIDKVIDGCEIVAEFYVQGNGQ